ncbi:MAG: cytochrome b/b6 domain-containing protein, partial [Gammaproteobacteria bacterium]|nr:cytochrome b/b6 domain-containing protein [Gammaproteobacteria bacterium]
MITNIEEISVWDIGVRLFHWLLVASFIIAYASAEEESLVHIYSGYMVLGLITFRLLWGFIGSKHARFSDFVYSPAKIVSYLKSLIYKAPEHYTGHNPAGGLMVVALLISLFVVTVSGLKLYAVEEGKGPLAAQMDISIVSTAYAD